jgi:hypothetical protein
MHKKVTKIQSDKETEKKRFKAQGNRFQASGARLQAPG